MMDLKSVLLGLKNADGTTQTDVSFLWSALTRPPHSPLLAALLHTEHYTNILTMFL